MDNLYFKLGHIGDNHDLKMIKRELDLHPGIHSVAVNAQDGTVSVDYDASGVSAKWIARRVESMGYDVKQSEVTQREGYASPARNQNNNDI